MATFTPDLGSPCATGGTSFRYSFFFQKGEEAYNIGSPTVPLGALPPAIEAAGIVRSLPELEGT